MAAEDGLKAQKLLAQGSALGNVGKIKVALKGQKLSISKLLPFQVGCSKSNQKSGIKNGVISVQLSY